MARLKDINWNNGELEDASFERAQLAVLMDLRDELKQMNRTSEHDAFAILRELRGLRRDIKKLAKGAALVALFALPFGSFAAPLPEKTAVRAIVGEAANQGQGGMLAVAGAIRNRGSLQGVYGGKNPIVIKQPAWVWRQARAAWARSATNDITHGATHWENFSAFGQPRWAKGMTVTTNIGAHTFMKEAK